MRKKGVLLGLIETMNFIHKKKCTDFKIPVLFSTFYDCLDVALMSSDSRKFDEIGCKFLSEDTSEGGFPSTRWAPENEVDGLFLFGNFG